MRQSETHSFCDVDLAVIEFAGIFFFGEGSSLLIGHLNIYIKFTFLRGLVNEHALFFIFELQISLIVPAAREPDCGEQEQEHPDVSTRLIASTHMTSPEN